MTASGPIMEASSSMRTRITGGSVDPAVPQGVPDFVQKTTRLLLEGRGEELPVSAFPPDGTWPTGTAKYEKRSLGVAYDLSAHTLRELDEHLVDKGYHLDNTLFTKLTRALIYYVEETQLHNMGAPEKRLKRSSQEAYVKAWEHHPHGDHDDTPPEWREYK